MNLIFKHTFVRFAIVGGAGFLVDLASMLLLSIWLPHIVARGFAFWVAASSNWWWNRTITFTDPKQEKKATAKRLPLCNGCNFLAALLLPLCLIGVAI
ncbi:GtrA family protein [Marinomonas polaris]|uniref:GtrA family protein n=1 Tax=Marinomonas polaris TaxID=293552 RepID=UPI003511CC40